MNIDDLIVEVRDENLQRVGTLTPVDLVGFTAVMRNNQVGAWSCALPVGHTLGEVLATPGCGLIISSSEGVLFSGPTDSATITRSVDDPAGVVKISGVDDSIILKDSLAFPTPSSADLTQQVTEFDVRTGVAETVMKAYVDANIGASAPMARRHARLTIETSSGLGEQVTGQARFETLYELLTGLAEGSGLSFTVVQDGDGLVFKTFQPTNRTGTIRLDIDNGRLKQSEYSYSTPTVTHTVVGGDGEGSNRTFIGRTSPKSVAASQSWGRRIERFLDQRGASELAKLEQAGDEVLTSDGNTKVSVSIDPSDDSTMLFGRDWFLGDRISCIVGPIELFSVVSEVGLSISADGVRIRATVGEPQGLDFESQLLTKQASAALRISKLERV